MMDELVQVICRHGAPIDAVNVLANLCCRTHACIGIVSGKSMRNCADNLHDVVDFLYPRVFDELSECAQLLHPEGCA